MRTKDEIKRGRDFLKNPQHIIGKTAEQMNDWRYRVFEHVSKEVHPRDNRVHQVIENAKNEFKQAQKQIPNERDRDPDNAADERRISLQNLRPLCGAT